MNKGFISIGLVLGIAIAGLVGGFLGAVFSGLQDGTGAVTALGDTINTFRTNVNSTDEALRSTTSTDPGHVHTTSAVSGTIAIAKGGLATSTAPANSAFLVGDGTNYQFSVIPDCNATSTDKLIYSSTTRTWTCSSDVGGASSTVALLNFSRVSSTLAITTSSASTFQTIGTSTAGGIASTTISTGAHRVMLDFSGSAFSTTTIVASFSFTIDGNNIVSSANGIYGFDVDTDILNMTMPIGYTFVTDTLTAGSHTFRAVFRTNTSNSLTFSAPFIFSVTELYN